MKENLMSFKKFLICFFQLHILASLSQSFTHSLDMVFMLQHPPPKANPQAFELLKIGLFKFPPFGAKRLIKCPTN